jgi:peroxiredoxin
MNKAFSAPANKIKYAAIFLGLLLASFNSYCQSKNYGEPAEPASVILSSVDSFYVYMEKKVNLSHDFIGLDVNENVLSKDAFLKILSSGDYLPLRLISKDSSNYYKLYKLKSSENSIIKLSVKGLAEQQYVYSKMLGSQFPDFNFTDLNGNNYNNKNTKEKIIVLKCWFIECPPCIDEMPALNDLIKQYENRKDIVFLSVSFNSKNELKNFLKKTTFNYAVVADQQNFLDKVLKIYVYPTHIIINKQGVIVNISNNSEELASALNNEALK